MMPFIPGGYAFPGYTPQAMQPTAPQAPTATLGQKRAAMLAGASHVSPDGEFCYRWRYGWVEQAIWYDDHYGSWWRMGDSLPEEAVKLE